MIRKSLFFLFFVRALLICGTPRDHGGHHNSVTTPKQTRKQSEKASSWEGMLTIDPSNVLSKMMQFSGLVLPKSIEKDVAVLKEVCSVQKAELNVVYKKLILYDLAIAQEGDRSALRFGRISIQWDSYIRPCLEIEVEDVDILVEFMNLMLTRSNWNELNEKGFPPAMSASTEDQDDGFVRFGSVNLSGNIKLTLASKPLGQDLHSSAFDLDVTDDVNEQIASLSDNNLQLTGRRGCTSNELSDLLESFFKLKIRDFLRQLAENPDRTKEDAMTLLSRAGDSIRSYASDAGKKKADDIKDTLVAKLDEFGVPGAVDKVDLLKEIWKRSQETK